MKSSGRPAEGITFMSGNIATGIDQTKNNMARQHGMTKLTGKMGDISFYITKYGALARTIGTVSKERFHNDPKLARRKAAALDFGYVSTTGKLLRREIGKCCQLAAEGTTNQRLNALLRSALKLDTVHKTGEKRMMANNAGLLKGFNWNGAAQVDMSLKVPLRVIMDASNEHASITISDLMPAKDVRMPVSVSHISIALVMAAVERDKIVHLNIEDKCAPFAVDSAAVQSISLSCALQAKPGALWVAGVGIHSFDERNGQLVEIPTGSGFMVLESGVW